MTRFGALDVRKNHEFGLFCQQQPRSVQWIEERRADLEIEPGRRTSGLKVRYEVPAVGSSNGLWLRPAVNDWSVFERGGLVLRLRVGESCTRQFRIEVKTGESDKVVAFPVALTDAQLAMTNKQRRGRRSNP